MNDQDPVIQAANAWRQLAGAAQTTLHLRNDPDGGRAALLSAASLLGEADDHHIGTDGPSYAWHLGGSLFGIHVSYAAVGLMTPAPVAPAPAPQAAPKIAELTR